MSENSFENSTYSENNSYDEASSNPPESLNSPSNNVDDDFGGNGVYGSRLTADLLTSLPVLTTVASAASSSAAYRSSHVIEDIYNYAEFLIATFTSFRIIISKSHFLNKSITN